MNRHKESRVTKEPPEHKSPIPEPPCKLGMTYEEVKDVVGPMHDFFRFMRGQTVALCTGTEYNPETEQTVDSNCGPHGIVYYSHDVNKYIRKQQQQQT